MSRRPAASEDDTYDYLCDLPSCSVTTAYEPLEEDDYPDEPPPGWFSASITQHGARPTALVYCSHAHMVEGLDEHLPEPVDASAPDQEGWLSALGCVLALLTFLAVLTLGVVTALMLVGDLLGWLAARW